MSGVPPGNDGRVAITADMESDEAIEMTMQANEDVAALVVASIAGKYKLSKEQMSEIIIRVTSN
jgi:hypothetical protein